MRQCDYMEEREDVRDLRGRSEPPPPSFSEAFFLPWNEWPEKDRLFLDEPAISIYPSNSERIRDNYHHQLNADLTFPQKKEEYSITWTQFQIDEEDSINKQHRDTKTRSYWNLPKQTIKSEWGENLHFRFKSNTESSECCCFCDKDAIDSDLL